MKKSLLFSLITCLCFTACKKDSKNQYSNWSVNGENYNTNNVTETIGKAITILSGQDTNNFGISFHTSGGLPLSGTFGLAIPADSLSQNPDVVHMDINNNGAYYIPSSYSNAVLTTSKTAEGKAQYNLQPTWFINYFDHSDSVIVQGHFNQP